MRALVTCLSKHMLLLKSCLELYCPHHRDRQELWLEKRVTLLNNNMADQGDNWGKLEELLQMRRILPETSGNEPVVPSSGRKNWLDLILNNRGQDRKSSKMAVPLTPEVEDTLRSVLTSIVERKRGSSPGLGSVVSKRRWSQEVAECIKLECSHMGSLAEIVPCQENCRAKWWRCPGSNQTHKNLRPYGLVVLAAQLKFRAEISLGLVVKGENKGIYLD